jgi:DUF2934 family protein
MAKSRKYQNGETSAPDAAGAPTERASFPGNSADYAERVSMRAYELYLARGGVDGQDFDDWLAAERELASDGESDRCK